MRGGLLGGEIDSQRGDWVRRGDDRWGGVVCQSAGTAGAVLHSPFATEIKPKTYIAAADLHLKLVWRVFGFIVQFECGLPHHILEIGVAILVNRALAISGGGVVGYIYRPSCGGALEVSGEVHRHGMGGDLGFINRDTIRRFGIKLPVNGCARDIARPTPRH